METYSVTLGTRSLTILGTTSGYRTTVLLNEATQVNYISSAQRNVSFDLTPNHPTNNTGAASNYVAPVPVYLVRVRMSNGIYQEIDLSRVTNQPTWTNNQAGAVQAVSDIETKATE